jgi:L,D-transpeptidase catalytic domain
MNRSALFLVGVVGSVLMLAAAPVAVLANTRPAFHSLAKPSFVQSGVFPTNHDGTLDQTPGQRLYSETHDASVLDPINWAVMAYKAEHRLDVYYKGRLFKSYGAVFSRTVYSPDHDEGAKLYSGDLRTPEGLYVITKEYPSRRFRWFLRLNYPNRVDRIRYEELREHGSVPIEDGRIPPLGGSIGIHGTDQPLLNRSDIDWTIGCISVDNSAIEELHRLLPIGTIVLIKP